MTTTTSNAEQWAVGLCAMEHKVRLCKEQEPENESISTILHDYILIFYALQHETLSLVNRAC